jgi:hypothetical protein
MDYYKNIDHLACNEKRLIASGVQYQTITDLTVEPVTVDFFKEHARIDFDTDDNLVAVYLKSARQFLEQWSQLSFGVKTIGLTALSLPKNYKLMHGKVDTILTAGFTNVGDILKEGGTDIDIEFTTKDWIDDAIRIAICRQAASFYINRETITDTKFSASVLENEAKAMIQPYQNLTLL